MYPVLTYLIRVEFSMSVQVMASVRNGAVQKHNLMEHISRDADSMENAQKAAQV